MQHAGPRALGFIGGDGQPDTLFAVWLWGCVNIDDYRREFLLLDVGLFTHWAKFAGHLLSPSRIVFFQRP